MSVDAENQIINECLSFREKIAAILNTQTDQELQELLEFALTILPSTAIEVMNIILYEQKMRKAAAAMDARRHE